MTLSVTARVEITFFRVGGSINCCDSVATRTPNEERSTEPTAPSPIGYPLRELDMNRVPSDYVLQKKEQGWVVRPPKAADGSPKAKQKEIQERTRAALKEHFTQQCPSISAEQLDLKIPQGKITAACYREVTQWVGEQSTSVSFTQVPAFPPAQYVLFLDRDHVLAARPRSWKDRLWTAPNDKEKRAWEIVKGSFEQLPENVKAALKTLMPEEEPTTPLTVGTYQRLFDTAMAELQRTSPDGLPASGGSIVSLAPSSSCNDTPDIPREGSGIARTGSASST